MSDAASLDASGKLLEAATRDEEEDRMLFHLTDDDMRVELLDIANGTEKAVIKLWLACEEYRTEPDGIKRKNFLCSMMQSFFGTDKSKAAKVISHTCVAALEKIVANRAEEEFSVDVVGPLQQEALTHLLGSGLVERRTVTPAKIRSGRDWVLGPEAGSADTEKTAAKLRRRLDEIRPKLADVGKASAAELHSWIKVLLPLLIVYQDKVEGHLDEIFARLEKLEPLSAEVLRRKAVMVSFVRTHKRKLPSDQVAVLMKTLSSFSFEEDSNKRTFSNAIEAFAQGRNFNKHAKSIADLKDVIPGLALFDGIKETDPALRKHLLDAEHAFESALVLQPNNNRLLWNWALHYFWVGEMCEAKRPVATGRLMLAAAKKCKEALTLCASHFKPLLLWGEILCRIMDHAVPYGMSVVEYATALEDFCVAVQRYCVRRPFAYDLSPLAKLAAKKTGFQGTSKVVARCLRNLTASGVGTRLRLDAAHLWLTMQKTGQVESQSLARLFKLVKITLADAEKHPDAFVALVRNEFYRKAKESTARPGPIPESKPTVAAEELAENTRKPWVPNPDQSAEELVRAEDPKKVYQFTGHLGHGGFGTVSLGRRRQDKLPVAIKEALKPYSHCKDEVLAEIQVMKLCRHPNIVHFIDALTHKNRVFIVMLYCDGGSLDTVIHKLTLREEMLAHIFLAVVLGLSFMERICLVHRDIKPGNILLSRNGDIRIGDLGLVKPQVETQFKHSLAGTPGFRAPEVLLGRGSTTKSDMYGFGCSLFASFYGDGPYHDSSSSVLLWKTTTVPGIPPYRPSERTLERTQGKVRVPSADLRQLLEACFELDPAKRVSAEGAKQFAFFLLDSKQTKLEVREMCDRAFLDNALENFGI